MNYLIWLKKSLLLQIIDQSWREHLFSLDHLRQGISLRAYGQRDPLSEYKNEAFIMFEEMMSKIRENVSRLISFVEIKADVPEPKSKNSHEPQNQNERKIKNSKLKKISRNAICPLCDSGKKYKRCCGRLH